jgi:hypothetical protein
MREHYSAFIHLYKTHLFGKTVRTMVERGNDTVTAFGIVNGAEDDWLSMSAMRLDPAAMLPVSNVCDALHTPGLLLNADKRNYVRISVTNLSQIQMKSPSKPLI